MANSLRWMVFSDSIFIGMPFLSHWNQQSQSAHSMSFVLTCAVVNRTMFELGFPLRGAIHTGSFMMGNKCLFGKSLIEAHEQANKLDLAACVFSPAALQYLKTTIPPSDQSEPFLRGLSPQWDVPTKDGPLRLATLNWLNIRMGADCDIEHIEDFVEKQFSAHGKKIDGKVQLKVDNTIRLLHFWNSALKRARQGAV